MKRMLFVSILAAALLTAVTAPAEDAGLSGCEWRGLACGGDGDTLDVRLLTADFTLNGTKINNVRREYPLLVYGGNIYFPLTYYDTRFMGVTTDYDAGTGTVVINDKGVSGMYRDYLREERNPDTLKASVFGGDIVINAASDSLTRPYEGVYDVDMSRLTVTNEKQSPPLLTFRDITYIPLADPYLNLLCWELTTETDGSAYYLNGNNFAVKRVYLPNYNGGAASVDSLGHYHYQGADGNIYCFDGENLRLLLEMPLDRDSGKVPEAAFCSPDGGAAYMYYRLGDGETGVEHWYVCGWDDGLKEVDYWNSLQNRRERWPDVEERGGGFTVRYHRVLDENGVPHTDRVSYTVKKSGGDVNDGDYYTEDVSGEFNAEGIEFSEALMLDDRLYFKGEKEGVASIYRLEPSTGAVSLYAPDIAGNFRVGRIARQNSPVETVAEERIFYTQRSASDYEFLDYAAKDEHLCLGFAALGKAGGGVSVKYIWNTKGDIWNVFSADRDFELSKTDGVLSLSLDRSVAGSDVNFAVFADDPFYTADYAEKPYIYRNRIRRNSTMYEDIEKLLYVVDGWLVEVDLTKDVAQWGPYGRYK